MIRLVNFIVKYPISILPFVFALNVGLIYVYMTIDKYLDIIHDRDMFILGIFYLALFVLVSAAAEIMLYCYILFLYQLKKVGKNFIFRMLLNFIILISFLVGGYYIAHVDFQRYSVGMAFCVGILLLFPINISHISFMSWKNKLNTSYVGAIVFSEIVGVFLVKPLITIILLSFSVSHSIIAICHSVLEVVAHLIPAFVFMYFARKLRKKRHEVS